MSLLSRLPASVASAPRRGISIMEVLFAVGVLTIGLVGVAMILPVATNNASSSLRDDRSAEEVSNRIASDVAKLNRAIDQLPRFRDDRRL